MLEVANDLRTALDTSQRLLQIDDASASRASNGKWSKKEILGHLIDSAANNHQRFVRLQFETGLALPGYQQSNWVNAQRYRERKWADLVELWVVYNRHLAHVIEHVDRNALQNVWNSPGGPVDLEFLMRDYVTHLNHHLQQLLPA
jgi:DinB family protein